MRLKEIISKIEMVEFFTDSNIDDIRRYQKAIQKYFKSALEVVAYGFTNAGFKFVIIKEGNIDFWADDIFEQLLQECNGNIEEAEQELDEFLQTCKAIPLNQFLEV